MRAGIFVGEYWRTSSRTREAIIPAAATLVFGRTMMAYNLTHTDGMYFGSQAYTPLFGIVCALQILGTGWVQFCLATLANTDSQNSSQEIIRLLLAFATIHYLLRNRLTYPDRGNGRVLDD